MNDKFIGCKGCTQFQTHIYEDDKETVRFCFEEVDPQNCPCKDCRVKPICLNGCNEFLAYEDTFSNKGKRYSIMKTIPCEQCITKAICLNKSIVVCPILFKWVYPLGTMSGTTRYNNSIETKLIEIFNFYTYAEICEANNNIIVDRKRERKPDEQSMDLKVLYPHKWSRY
jgi:hypothetical protein